MGGSGGGGSGQAIPVPPWAETPSLLPTGPEVLRFVPQEPPGRRFLPTVPAPAATLGIRKGPGVSRLPGPSSVDAGGLKPNTWQRLERLSSAWNQAKLVLGDQPDGAADDEPGVVVNPRRRARTPLTESQVDAIRTARANGESVVSICQRFNVHRMTVWTHTRDLF